MLNFSMGIDNTETARIFDPSNKHTHAMNNNSIHLIGIGRHIAKPASEVCPGDVLVWNFGYVGKVTRILGETAAFVTIEIIENGKLYTRRLKKSRPVAYTTKVTL